MSETMIATPDTIVEQTDPIPATAPHRLKVENGVIRGRYVLFRLIYPDDFAGWDRLSVHFELTNGVIMPVPAAAAVREPTKTGVRMQFKLPKKKTLGAIRLVPDDPSVAEIVLPLPSEYGLSDLYPLDDGKEMPEALSRANTVRDVETLNFILMQILKGKDHTDYAKTEVVKKFAYKCMQNGKDEDILRAIELINSMWHMVEVFDNKYGKKNPIHLKVSFLFIRMLCHNMVGDFDSGLKDMEDLFELRKSIPEAPLISSNLCRATLLFAWALGMGGDTRRADLVFEGTITGFREAAAFMPVRRQRPFTELNTTLRAASQAVGCVVALRKVEVWNGDPGARYLVTQHSRLEGVPAQKRFARRLEELAAYIKAHGAERRWSGDLALQAGEAALPPSGG